MLKYVLTLIPLAGTTLGAILGITGNKERLKKGEEVLVAVATGVLCSVAFNLLIELRELLTSRENLLWFWGGWAGAAFSFAMDKLAQYAYKNREEGFTAKEKIFWAMIIHNIPEGIVIGMTLADKAVLPATISLLLSISLQNIPDGIVVSMPIVGTKGKLRAICYGFMSGIVEPVIAILLIFSAGITPNIQAIEPFLIGFSVITILWILYELLDECKEHKFITVAVAVITIVFNLVL